MIASDTLQEALAEADLRVLLMVLFHMTGDRVWLSEKYRTKRDINLIADEDAGLPPEVRAEVIEAAAAMLADPGAPAVGDPGDDLMVEMMRACLAENVPEDYAQMMREEMGFRNRKVQWSGARPAMRPSPVIIVGAGASGITVAANLEDLGIPYVIFEENDEVGGTWLVNTYPGCAVDTPNHAYSWSFGSRYPWTRFFSRRDELHAYMVERSHEFGIRGNIRFGHKVLQTDWDEDTAEWVVRVESAAGVEVVRCWALISAIGPLSLPRFPDFPGAGDFQGRVFHSNRWPSDLDLTGKRVAVIGTGASSMQIVPSIVDQVGALHVYQRTPQWVRHIPRFKDAMTDGARWLLQNVPFYAEWFRFTMLWRYGDGLHRTLKRDPDWPHPERSMNRMNDRHRVQMAEFIEAELEGRPDLVAKCLPSYPPYAKRILLDNGWYQALRKPQTDLITESIERITAEGVRTEAADRPYDVIVLATGFRVFSNAARLNVTGRGGVKMADEWAGDDPKAHLGITAPGFPNMFFIQGPNTVLAHGGSAIFTSECQSRYAVGALVRMLEEGLSSVDVRREVHDAYMDRVDAEHRDLVWAHPGMTPWYRNKAGRVAAALPWKLIDYYQMTYEPDFGEYEVRKAG